MWKRISVYFLVGMMACSEAGTDEMGAPTGNQVQFDIWSTGNELIGVVVFSELDNGSFNLDVELNTPFQEIASVDFVEDNGLDGKSVLGKFGTMDPTSTAATFEKPRNLKLNYADVPTFDGHIGFSVGTKKLGFADIGDNVYSGEIVDYELFDLVDPNVFGRAYLRKRVNEETVFIIDVEGTKDGDSHPCHFHRNTSAQGGSIVIDLNYVKGETGISMTNAIRANNGSKLTFESLLDFNGFIRIHKSDEEFNIAITEGDIGQNRLTGRTIEYAIPEVSGSGISGSVKFSERANGNILADMELSGTANGMNYPVIINENDASDPGAVLISLNDFVSGDEVSFTEITETDEGSNFTFDDLLDLDGHLNVYEDAISNLVSQVDIGQNELTGNRVDYAIQSENSSGITGTVSFEERVNQQTLVTIVLQGFGNKAYEASLFSGPASGSGTELISLRNVDSQSGISRTNITRRNDGNTITYEQMINLDAHLEISDQGTKQASADVGSNG